MNAAKANCRSYSDSEWFIPWFNSIHYNALYAHRDEVEAARFIDTLIARLHPKDDATVLDLACGSGRHARHLASKGFRVLGLDLSVERIREAKQSEGRRLWFRRQDMRLPFGTHIFDYVFNLFTSFGYFDDPADHLTVVHNVAQSLKAGGCFVLDYLNVADAEMHLVPEEAIVRERATYHIARWADADHIFKRIVVDDADTGRREYVERVARLTVEDFRFMFKLCDMKIECVCGDYRFSPFDANSSPRLIIVARKRAGVVAATSPARQALSDAADGLGRHAEVRREHCLWHAKRNRRIHTHEFEVPLFGRSAQ